MIIYYKIIQNIRNNEQVGFCLKQISHSFFGIGIQTTQYVEV